MYKMVFTDLDGTIVSSDGISKSTIQTIEDLRKKDILFTFATGRHFSSVKGVLEELNIKMPYICGNGAYVYDPVKKKVVSETLLSEETAKEVLQRSNEYGLDFLVYTNKEMFGTERATEIIKNRLKDHFEIKALTEEELNVLPVDNILKFLIIEDNEELILRLKDEFSMFKGLL